MPDASKPQNEFTKAILLDLSEKNELRLLSALVKQVSATAEKPYLLAGATARDLLLDHALGIPNSRATADVDLAFLVGSWAEFEILRKRLISEREFAEVPRGSIHKLRFREALEVDILPFGDIERRDRTISWPPENAFVMTMLGYREALASSVTVILPDDARVQVVSLPALAILKLSAWVERRIREPRKDAYDLLLIISNYATASGERLYDANPYVGGSPSDYEAGGAWLLGKDMARLLDEEGHERLAQIITDEADEAGQLRLVGDMMRNDPERALALLAALEDGFIGRGE